MDAAKRVGLCHKCHHRITAPGPRLDGVQAEELIGCKIELMPQAGENCPLIKDGFRGVTRAAFVEDCYTLVLTTTFKGKDGMFRCLSVSGMDSVETAQAMCNHLGLGIEVRKV